MMEDEKRAVSSSDLISRRDVFNLMALSGLALPLTGCASQGEIASPSSESLPVFAQSAMPAFSVEEQDRRWSAVRAIMARPTWNLDAIIAPSRGDQAYVRYLTQMGGPARGADVIFPLDANQSTYALARSSRARDFWIKRLTTQLSDGRLIISEGEGSEGVVEGLKALGLNKPGTRIGVAKLMGTRFEPEGLVSATYLDNLKAALPGVLFLPIERWGTDPGPVEEVAMVKSLEEQEVIRRCVAAGEKAVETLIQAANGSGKKQEDLWLPAFITLLVEGGEVPSRLSLSLDQRANTTMGSPVEDPVNEGQIVSQEIAASVQGYQAQVNHSFFVGTEGTPGFDYYRAAMEVTLQVHSETLASIVPGETTCGQLVDLYSETVQRLNAEDAAGVVLHSSGLGTLSRPRLGPSSSRQDEDIVIVPGMTFDFKPVLRLKRSVQEDVGAENRSVQIGDHILVTETGAVRLGKRALTPIATGG